MHIKLSDRDKIQVDDTEEVYQIMRRILMRENKIDRDKEHFWTIGLNTANVIQYIELIGIGSYKEVLVEPMNVFRVAILKGACKIIGVHNHPSGTLNISDPDKSITEVLLKAGRIIKIKFVDHLIITPKSYISLAEKGLFSDIEEKIDQAEKLLNLMNL